MRIQLWRLIRLFGSGSITAFAIVSTLAMPLGVRKKGSKKLDELILPNTNTYFTMNFYLLWLAMISWKKWTFCLLELATKDNIIPILIQPSMYVAHYYFYSLFNEDHNSHFLIDLQNVFATAAFRFGHAMLPDSIPWIDKNNATLQTFDLNDLVIDSFSLWR